MEFDDKTQALLLREVLESTFLSNPPKTEDEIRGYSRAIAKFVNNEEEVKWLFERIRSGCTYFPKPIEARRVHNRLYHAADKNPEGGVMRLDQADLTDTVKGE